MDKVESERSPTAFAVKLNAPVSVVTNSIQSRQRQLNLLISLNRRSTTKKRFPPCKSARHSGRRADDLLPNGGERVDVVGISPARQLQPWTHHRRAQSLQAADLVELLGGNAQGRQMFIQTTTPLRPLEAVLSVIQGGARNDEVVALDHALGVELQFVIDRLIDAIHFRQAGVSLPVDHEAEDVPIGRLGEDSQDGPLARQFGRKLVAQAAAQLLRAPDAFADEQPVAALIERDDAVREPAGCGRRARLEAFQNVPADERAGLRLMAVEDVWRFGRDQLFDILATEDDRAARVRDVAEFVRINGD